MTRTTAHILKSVVWLFALPAVVVPPVVSGAWNLSPVASIALSAAWTLGFIAVFASWSLQDAPLHGKTKSVALAFSAAWLLLSFLAVVPYLYATRGARAGTLAALKFLSLCLACGIAWLAVPRVFGLLH